VLADGLSWFSAASDGDNNLETAYNQVLFGEALIPVSGLFGTMLRFARTLYSTTTCFRLHSPISLAAARPVRLQNLKEKLHSVYLLDEFGELKERPEINLSARTD